MSAIRTTHRLLSAYSEREPWRHDHDRAMLCRDIDEAIAWGMLLFTGLNEIEATFQQQALDGKAADVPDFLKELDSAYRSWNETSEKYLALADELAREGYQVNRIDEFRATVAECRCLLGNLEIEESLPAIEELSRIAKPNNPRPDRYP